MGPEGTQIIKVCTNVHTCMYICHLAPPPPATDIAIRRVKQGTETARFRIGSTLQSKLVSILNMLAVDLI